MSVLEQRDTQTAPVTGATYVNGDEPAFPTRIVLQPIAAPSVLGWFGFAGATFIVAFGALEELRAPLTDVQKIAFIEAALLEFDGFEAQLDSLEAVGEVLRALRWHADES